MLLVRSLPSVILNGWLWVADRRSCPEVLASTLASSLARELARG
jgi:hypothetical protein